MTLMDLENKGQASLCVWHRRRINKWTERIVKRRPLQSRIYNVCVCPTKLFFCFFPLIFSYLVFFNLRKWMLATLPVGHASTALSVPQKWPIGFEKLYLATAGNEWAEIAFRNEQRTNLCLRINFLCQFCCAYEIVRGQLTNLQDVLYSTHGFLGTRKTPVDKPMS